MLASKRGEAIVTILIVVVIALPAINQAIYQTQVFASGLFVLALLVLPIVGFFRFLKALPGNRRR